MSMKCASVYSCLFVFYSRVKRGVKILQIMDILFALAMEREHFRVIPRIRVRRLRNIKIRFVKFVRTLMVRLCDRGFGTGEVKR